MIRYCFSTATPIKAYQKSTGEWTIDGISAGAYLDGIDIFSGANKPFNTSFFFTPDTNECLQRLSNNESDSSSVFLPIETLAPGYFVPHPLIAGKLQFVTGYNITSSDQEIRDSATVSTNLYLLQPPVYLVSLSLLVSFITFIALRISMIYFHCGRMNKLPLIFYIKREIGRMFYHSSEQFKLMTMLYSVLCFYLVTTLLCVYKTSQVILEKPFYPKSYQESLEHSTSLAFFYDQLADVSSKFRNAPRNSLRGKLWTKLARTGRQYDYTGGAKNPATLPMILNMAAHEIKVLKGIFIAAPLVGPMLKSIACGTSPENELWIIKLMSDPIEPEIIYGQAISSISPFTHFLSQRMQILFETSITAHGYELGVDTRAESADVVATSKDHQWRQRVVCESENDAIPVSPVHGIPLSYFRSFFAACLLVWLFAFCLNIFQILYGAIKPRRPRCVCRKTRPRVH